MTFRLLVFFFLPALLLAEVGYVEPWGKDADLAPRSITQRKAPSSLSPMGKVAESVILFHRTVLTKTTCARSHFRPSSSGYMLEAIRKNGFFKGYIMGCDRLLRENGDPWIYRKTLDNGKLYKSDVPRGTTKTIPLPEAPRS